MSSGSVAANLTDILEANDAALLAAALSDIARARGMTEIAKSVGNTCEALYAALRPDCAPGFDMVSRVCEALRVRQRSKPYMPKGIQSARFLHWRRSFARTSLAAQARNIE